jgi:cytochrome P450
MTETTHLDLLSADFYADPYPTYAELRADAPVAQVHLPDGRPAWLFTRYADIAAVLQDHERFSNRAMLSQVRELPELSPRAQDVMSLFALIMSSADPPDHTRLRRLVQRAFASSLVEGLRPYVQHVADELLDAVEERARSSGVRAMDLVADYAFPLPAAVIMRLLGVPSHDRENIRRWSQPLMKFDRSPQSAERLAPEIGVFIDYVRALLDVKRRNPSDDLLSALAAETSADALTELELVSLTFQLIFAGHSTTSHLIGNGTLALLTHPDQLERLRADPSLIRSAVEELLRYNAPQQLRARLAVADVDVGGVTIRRGDVVLLALASGNRDAAQFPDADALDVARDDNRHLSFGLGIHRCFIRRMPDLRLAVTPEELSWPPSGLFQRGLTALPVTF